MTKPLKPNLRKALWLIAAASAVAGCTPPPPTPVPEAKTVSWFDGHKDERKARLAECRDKGISSAGDTPAIRECNAARTSQGTEYEKLQEDLAKTQFEISRLKSEAAWAKFDRKTDERAAKRQEELALAEGKMQRLQGEFRQLQ